MNTINIIVNLFGLALIAGIIWYFWLWQGKTVAAQQNTSGVQEVDITVKGGYQPATIMVKAGQLLRLKFTRREASTCGEDLILSDFGKRVHLPENRTITVEVTPQNPGEYQFTCGMNMYRGKVIVK